MLGGCIRKGTEAWSRGERGIGKEGRGLRAYHHWLDSGTKWVHLYLRLYWWSRSMEGAQGHLWEELSCDANIPKMAILWIQAWHASAHHTLHKWDHGSHCQTQRHRHSCMHHSMTSVIRRTIYWYPWTVCPAHSCNCVFLWHVGFVVRFHPDWWLARLQFFVVIPL